MIAFSNTEYRISPMPLALWVLRPGKTPTVYTDVASVVAFMGPQWRRPPVFYISSMMAVAANVFATVSSISTRALPREENSS